MRTYLDTKDYDFFVEKDKIWVRYIREDKEDKVVSITDINIQMIGIVSGEDTWTTTIVTPASIKKLRDGITDKLVTIGFHFNNLQTAIEVQTFILYWNLKNGRKAKDKTKEGK